MAHTKKYDVVVAGYTCVDLTPEFRSGNRSSITEIFRPGQLTEIDGISFLPGGVVPNTGMALKRFGKEVYLNGLAGDDFMGSTLTEWLGRYDLAEGIQITREEGTAFSIVIAPPGVDRIFLEATGCNRIFGTGHIDYEAAARSRIFHFGYPPLLKQFFSNDGEQLVKMFTKVQKAGIVTSLDFSLPDPDSASARVDWNRILKQLLPQVDICTPSLEEALQIIMPDEYTILRSKAGEQDLIDLIPDDLIRETGRKFIAYGVRILLIKAAHRGACLFTGDISTVNGRLGEILDKESWNHRELWQDAYPVNQALVKNATGAGDTAVAAFLAAILEGRCPDITLKYAALAGRNSLYCHNLYEELEDWQQMTGEIEKGTG